MPDSRSSGAAVSEAPERAGLVLAALILVAGVANLNLSVANVALPDIGRHFDSSQTTLDLIAVGYSLGLAASVLYLGARGRPLRTQVDAAARDGAVGPGVPAGGVCPERLGAVHRARARRSVGGHGLSDDAGVDCGVVVGAWADEVDRVVVGAGRCDRLAGAVGLRRAAGALLVGIGVSDHLAARCRCVPDGHDLRSQPCQRDDRAGRQPRRHPLGRAGRGA